MFSIKNININVIKFIKSGQKFREIFDKIIFFYLIFYTHISKRIIFVKKLIEKNKFGLQTIEVPKIWFLHAVT